MTDELAEFKDKGSLPFIEQLFKEKLVDESILTLNEIYNEYGGKYNYFFNEEITNTLYIFKENSFYRESNTGDSLDQQINGYNTRHIKIGRNDICPCGSSKKYKKCCMLLLEWYVSTKIYKRDISKMYKKYQIKQPIF